MKIAITGAGGMIGRKLANRLALDGKIGDQEISGLWLHDAVACPSIAEAQVPIETIAGDLTDPRQVQQLLDCRPDVIFHLAAVVSGEAERDFDKGYRVNLDATRQLLETVRKLAYCPRFIFASSVAVFGAPLPNPIPDSQYLTPLTSYGTQKAICELLISDYSRRGMIDGLALRLPTICVRPGKPNAAASGFFSSIIREPLAGLEAQLPVSDDVQHWHASPRTAVGFLMHAAQLDTSALGASRAITLPGVAVTVGQQIAALQRVAGDEAVQLIRRNSDATIQQIVAGWPQSFQPTRALALGFRAESSFDEIIQVYLEDDAPEAGASKG
ncbi:MAG: SDR family oxidoreductase [Planctomycetales bacterium]|nr:SDR family oxidoreductase [Planctomycetales bacterium]